MPKKLKINGVDYTKLGTPVGYSVKYRKVYGQNAGTTQSGDYVDDVLAWKADITWRFLPLDEDQLGEVLANVCSGTYCSVYFYDARLGAYRTAEMRASEPTQTYRGTGANGLDYWTGTTFTFMER